MEIDRIGYIRRRHHHTSVFGLAILSGDYVTACDRIRERFGVVVSAEVVDGWWGAFQGRWESGKRGCAEDWSDGSWMAWVKNRLMAGGLLAGVGERPGEIWFGVELHVGYLSVVETPEQLGRLKHWTEPVREGRPTTPGIVRRGSIGPIDRVAARVV